MATKKQLKNSNNSYVRGCKASVDILLKQVLSRKLEHGQAMYLLTVFSIHLEAMIKRKDSEPPFISRAMAKALEQAGIEDYETALARMIHDPAMA